MAQYETAYEALGGEVVLAELIHVFYFKYVANDPTIAHIFPDDLTDTARKQQQFLTQFLGGPPLYTEEHGHPMLRRRHLPFVIGHKEKEAWLHCMQKAMDEIGITGEIREYFFERLTLVANHMMNQPSD